MRELNMDRVAFLGGTGPEGIGLAVRKAMTGIEVLIGSRSEERAEEAAAKVRKLVPAARVRGLLNADAAAEAGYVTNTLPYSAQVDTLTALRDAIGSKLVISAVVPIEVSKNGVSALPVPEGSAAEQAQAILPDAAVVGRLPDLERGEPARSRP